MRKAIFNSRICAWPSVWRVPMLTFTPLIICEASCAQAALSKQPVGTGSKALKHVAYT